MPVFGTRVSRTPSNSWPPVMTMSPLAERRACAARRWRWRRPRRADTPTAQIATTQAAMDSHIVSTIAETANFAALRVCRFCVLRRAGRDSRPPRGQPGSCTAADPCRSACSWSLPSSPAWRLASPRRSPPPPRCARRWPSRRCRSRVDARGGRRALLIAVLAALACARGAHARDRALDPPLAAWFDQAAGGADRLEQGRRRSRHAGRRRRARRGRRAAGHRCRRHSRRARTAARSPAAFRRTLAARSLARPVVALDGRAQRRRPDALRRPPVALNSGGPAKNGSGCDAVTISPASIKSASLVEVARGHWFSEAAAAARAHVRANGRHTVSRGARTSSAAVVTAILIGDRAGLDDDMRAPSAGGGHVSRDRDLGRQRRAAHRGLARVFAS